MSQARERLMVAVDVAEGERAVGLVRSLVREVRYFKVGLELHNALGPRILELIYGEGGRVFLDLKFHDIPSMVGRAARVVTGLGVWGFSVHVMGGTAMMQAACDAASDVAADLQIPKPRVLGLTLLTHIDQNTLNDELKVPGDLSERVVWQAERAKAAGLDGAIASPREVEAVRRTVGEGFTIVTPGIRPAWAPDAEDQRRIMTPAQALRAGADVLVVGRPVTTAADPLDAARRILAEMEETLV